MVTLTFGRVICHHMHNFDRCPMEIHVRQGCCYFQWDFKFTWWYLVGLRIVMKIVYGGKLNASLYIGQ